MSIVTVKRTERGWCGHFICGDRCQFRRNTLLEYENVRIVVSTIGAMRRGHEPGYDTVGAGRYYETMAFMAKWEAPYWDADVEREVAFTSQWAIGEIGHGSDNEANQMHEVVVSELALMLAAGMKLEVRS